MRIIAGKFRGTVLADVGKGDPAAHLRPTGDRTRESLFNLLTHRDLVQGARVLDLFSGTGALGLEALSRGAETACFVDDGKPAMALLQRNIALTRSQSDTRSLKRDATDLGPCDGAAFDLIFLDPPYGKGLGQRALTSALQGGWLADSAFVVWEESTPQMPPPGFELVDQRRYGDTYLTLLERV